MYGIYIFLLPRVVGGEAEGLQGNRTIVYYCVGGRVEEVEVEDGGGPSFAVDYRNVAYY